MSNLVDLSPMLAARRKPLSPMEHELGKQIHVVTRKDGGHVVLRDIGKGPPPTAREYAARIIGFAVRDKAMRGRWLPTDALLRLLGKAITEDGDEYTLVMWSEIAAEMRRAGVRRGYQRIGGRKRLAYLIPLVEPPPTNVVPLAKPAG